MVYPLISEYTEAILSAEDNFNELSYLRPVLDDKGNPIMSSGNFAVVYKMVDVNTGKYHAVKCFTRDQENRPEAYKAISKYISQLYHHNYLINVNYIEDELFVVSSQTDKTEFPILLMDWVEGKGLEEYVFQYMDNEEKLEELYENFKKFVSWLLPSHFAHGDLKPDNIIITPQSKIVLIDYDGMFVPSMFGHEAPELGTPFYTHPLRSMSWFDEYMDDYAAFLILLLLQYTLHTNIHFSDLTNKSFEQIIISISPWNEIEEFSKIISALFLIKSLFYIPRTYLSTYIISHTALDHKRELELIKKGNEGDEEAMFTLFDSYIKGNFTIKNFDKALFYGLKLINSNSIRSCSLCHFFRNPELKGIFGNDQDNLMDFLANKKICWALCNKGGTFKEDQIENLKESCEKGFAPAMYSLHFKFIRDKEYEKAIDLITRAAELGYVSAIKTLAQYYIEGEYVKEDLKKSFDYFLIAANKNDGESQFKIGLAYNEGIENYIPIDHIKKIEWMEKAASNYYIKANQFLSYCYLKGIGVQKDYSKAFEWIVKTKDSDDATCYLKIGVYYQNGIGTERNVQEAYNYYLKSIYASSYSSDAEFRMEILCRKYNLADQIDSLTSEESELMGEINTPYHTLDGKRFLNYDNNLREYRSHFSIWDGCEILCDYSFSEIYDENELDGSLYLKYLKIPETVKRIGNNVFSGNIRKIKSKSPYFEFINNSLISSDRKTFVRYFGKEKDIVLPATVKYVKGGAFAEKNIRKFTIPENLVYISSNPFCGTGKSSVKKFNNIEIVNESKHFLFEKGGLYQISTKSLISYIGPSKIFRILNGVEVIGENSLWDSDFEDIYLPKSIKKIYFNSFYRCWNLKRIHIPKGLKEYFIQILPEYLFDNQEPDLKLLTYWAPVPDKVEIIEY